MSLALYDVDKPHPFDRLVIIPITSPDFVAYGESDAEEIGIAFTRPQFLGTLRRVDYEGRIAKLSETFTVSIPAGSRIGIDTSGGVCFFIGQGCYVLGMRDGTQAMCSIVFEDDDIGEFGEYLTMSEDCLDNFLNSYKRAKPANKGKKSKSNSRVLKEVFESETEELSFED
jgi:hypothetical protein